jgi:hypothetical protein
MEDANEGRCPRGSRLFSFCFGVRAIEALIQFKAASRRRHLIRLHGLRRSLHSSVGRHLAIALCYKKRRRRLTIWLMASVNPLPVAKNFARSRVFGCGRSMGIG